MEVPINMPILNDGRGDARRRSSQFGGRRSSSTFRRNSDLVATVGPTSVLLKLSHNRSEDDLEKVRAFLLETPGLKQLCSSIPKIALDELCQSVKISEYSPEELICREGDLGDKLHFIVSGTATEYQSTSAAERIVNSGGQTDKGGAPDSPVTRRPYSAHGRLSTVSTISMVSRVSELAGGPAGMVEPQIQKRGSDSDEPPKLRGVKTIQMPFLRVDMTEKKDQDSEDPDQQEKVEQEERLRALSGIYATSPPRGGRSGATSPERDPKEKKKDSPEQIRRASQMLRSRAMSRRESVSFRNKRKSRFVSNAGFALNRKSMMPSGGYRSRQYTTFNGGAALIEYGLKYGYLNCYDSFGELSVFSSTEKHKLTVLAGQDGCLTLSIDRVTVSRIHNFLAGEGRSFINAVKLWASRRILNKPPPKRHDIDLHICATLLADLAFFKNLKQDAKKRVCKQLVLSSYEPKTIICKQGDTGNRIYGILLGKVSKHHKKITGPGEEGSELRHKLLNTSSLGQIGFGGKGKNARASMGKAIRVTQLVNQFTISTTQSISSNKFKQMMSAEYDPSKSRIPQNMQDSIPKIFGAVQEEINHGGTIGSLTLLKQNQTRQSSCISQTLVETASIVYDEFNKCVSQSEEESIKERVELLCRIALFKQLSKPELKRIIQMGKTKTYAKDQGIMRAEEKGTGCYIILSGEASLSYGNTFMKSKLHSGLKVRPKSAVPFRKSQRESNNFRGANLDTLPVSLLGPGSYFGQESLDENYVFEYNVIATRKTEVLVLSLRELTYLSVNSNGQVDTWASRIREWRQERVNSVASTNLKTKQNKNADDGHDDETNDESSDVNSSSGGKAKESIDLEKFAKVDIKKKLVKQKLPKKKNQKNASSLMKNKGQSKKDDEKDVQVLLGIVDGHSWRISSSSLFPADHGSSSGGGTQSTGARNSDQQRVRPYSAKPPRGPKKVTINEEREVTEYIIDDNGVEDEDEQAAASKSRDDLTATERPALRRNSEIAKEMRKSRGQRPMSAPPRSSEFQIKMGIPAAFPQWKVKPRPATPTGGGFGFNRGGRI